MAEEMLGLDLHLHVSYMSLIVAVLMFRAVVRPKLLLCCACAVVHTYLYSTSNGWPNLTALFALYLHHVGVSADADDSNKQQLSGS
jgi:hypothetical protein